MVSGSKAWLRTAYVCAALLVVPTAGIVLIVVSPGSSSAESDEPRGVKISGDSSAQASPGAANPRKVPAKVRTCCAALGKQARTAKIDQRPAYAEAAKACNEAARGDDPPSALETVASSLGGQTVPLPKECR